MLLFFVDPEMDSHQPCLLPVGQLDRECPGDGPEDVSHQVEDTFEGDQGAKDVGRS